MSALIRSDQVPVKLFVGMLSNHLHLFKDIQEALQEMHGPVDMEGPVWPWEHTDYYAKEMGSGLKRKFIFFEQLIHPSRIAGIKLETVKLEKKYQNETGGRRINIDPGYMDSARVALVSTDDYSHRLYIGKGIYGEVTLIYAGNRYRIFPFTYPDFRRSEYHNLFKKARRLYRSEMNKKG